MKLDKEDKKKSFSFIDILKMIGDRVPTKEEKKILQEMLDEIKKKYLENKKWEKKLMHY